jgi:hypothetical protein
MVKAASLNMKMDISKFAAIVPAAIATPAFASVDVSVFIAFDQQILISYLIH